jgi:hypothetical protein
MNGEQIPNLDANDRIRYLGGWISPWEGLVLEGIEDHLQTVLERVEHLALKPHQKAQLISAHIIPHYLYPLILAVPPITTIRKLDQELRRSIKKIYHLPSCTANGLIYCKKKDGGLGFPKLETVITGACLKTGLKFLDNDDPVMKAITEVSQIEQKLRKTAMAARLEWPLRGIEAINQYKLREKKNEKKRWARLTSQGKAVNNLSNDKIANSWLSDPKTFKPSTYILKV